MALTAPPPSLIVSDVFGPTVQGDGPSAGRRCSVISLGGCNLSCGWCDNQRAWNGARYDLEAEVRHRMVKNILSRALECRPGLVVVTGGEPLMQQRQAGWRMLLEALVDVDVEVETNGTIAPGEESLLPRTTFLVSPKLGHAGDPAWSRIRPEILQLWGDWSRAGLASFSFVVRDSLDVTTATSLVRLHDLPPERVWIVPEGTTSVGVLDGAREVAESALAVGFNLSARLHVALWGAAARPTFTAGLPVS